MSENKKIWKLMAKVNDLLVEERYFFTGSRIYGKPKKDSDLDVVVRASPDMHINKVFEGFYPRTTEGYDLENGHNTCWYSEDESINLIVKEEKEFEAWGMAKNICVDIVAIRGEKLEKAEAIEVHDLIRKLLL